MVTKLKDEAQEAKQDIARYRTSRTPVVSTDELATVIKTQVNRKLEVDRRLQSMQTSAPDHEFDAFVSHASEDKDEFVRPLAQRLASHGVRIWYDEHQLQVGDSLREAIERGLTHSSYGIVVLSPKFFEKRCPQRELNGLTARENNGKKVILLVWFILNFAACAWSPAVGTRGFVHVTIVIYIATFGLTLLSSALQFGIPPGARSLTA